MDELTGELADSEVGILCITPHNLDSAWLLFEAGALSNKMERSRVCPVLFGMKQTDLKGPLKQFQCTEFLRNDFRSLVGTVNDSLGDEKLPPKTLEAVFEKWWPDLEEAVNRVMRTEPEPKAPIRSDRELLEEILALTRRKQATGAPVSPRAVVSLMDKFIELHDQQAQSDGGYQDTLDLLRQMSDPVLYIALKSRASDEAAELVTRFRELTYQVLPKYQQEARDDHDTDDEISLE